MTPLQELQAAHKRLSELRGAETWATEFRDDHGYGVTSSARVWWIAKAIEEERDADLIVTLHRTIEAQLELLESAMRFLGEVRGGNSYKGPAFTLAGAINGEAS